MPTSWLSSTVCNGKPNCNFFAIGPFGGRDGEMPRYDIYVLCDDCREEHPMGMVFRMDDGPAVKRSIGDTYEGKSLPPQILAIEAHKTLCPKTGKLFSQKDHHQIFLVPS
jgi:hypothetical protein